MIQVWIEFVSLGLIVVGALNWGCVGVLGFNVVSWVAQHTFYALETVVYVLVGVAALVHLFSRDYYLPFLGKCVYPCGSLAKKTPHDADVTIEVTVEPNCNVIYWAAEPKAKVVDNPWIAYSEYENTGVARADERGHAVLKVRKPAAYNVPGMLYDKTLRPHIHYRTCTMDGMLSRVETAYI